MYNIDEIKRNIITHIQSQINTPIVICQGGYEDEKEQWNISKCESAIESVYNTNHDWYVSFKICQLNPDRVFGYYESEDSNATDYAEYEGLSLEALYQISNYLEIRRTEIRVIPKNYHKKRD